MIVGHLISDSIVPLKTSDTGEFALGIMSEYYVRHLPIVNNQDLLGVISEEDILDHNVNDAVGSYPLSLNRAFVRETDHFYEVVRVLSQNELTVVPVIDSEQQFQGAILLEDIVKYFASFVSVTERGSIIVVEMSRRDYSLAEMSRIVESNGAAILSSYITTTGDHSVIDVTIKVNKQNVQSILSTFERFKYNVKASYQEEEYQDTLKERYDSLITYLNV